MDIRGLHTSNRFLIRDPVHGYMVFNREEFDFLLDVIDSFEFQRLRRIKQLGTTYFVYPGADHSRFGHCIGTTWLALQFGKKFMEDGIETSEELMSKLLLTALIHDVGHGPFSHVFEKITEYNHEEMTMRFIEKKLPEMVPVFSGMEIKRIHKKELQSENAWIGDFLNSKIDVDRMDFSLRDSLYTGVDYGRFDMQRVFHSLVIGDIEGENHLIMLLKGLHAFEGFFIARHHMYWQVYFHKTTRSCEVIMEKIILRMKETIEDLDIEIPHELENLLSKKRPDVEEFFLLDDCTILETIKKCRSSKDKILRDLSNRFFRRKIFKCVRRGKIEDIGNIIEIDRRIRKFYEERNISYEYYFAYDDPEKISVERPVAEKGLLMADKDKSGNISGVFDFTVESKIILPLYNVKYTEFRMYCPEYLEEDLKELLSSS
ncbi:MAG: HD domain-containing protein [Theionarchaea archaeon]|nr:HD domain-containing protein [Theionarchaea archaeon]